jgi:hypothetical protein
MVDPLTAATTFATIVSLISQFRGEAELTSRHEYEDFLCWLSENQHDEIKSILESNTRTTISIKALLHEEHKYIKEKLERLNEGILDLAKNIEGLADLAAALETSNTTGKGGEGGSGQIIGDNGTILGGRGGQGGTSGAGGKGGSGIIQGDNGLIIGGDGGNAGTSDGRGGRGARSPMERADTATDTWIYGRGGAGANSPEYDRRIAILKEIRTEYMKMFPDELPFIEAGVDPVPLNWVNKRLEERNESWRIDEIRAGGYVLPPLL